MKPKFKVDDKVRVTNGLGTGRKGVVSEIKEEKSGPSITLYRYVVALEEGKQPPSPKATMVIKEDALKPQ